jgi:hypothetical protein
VIHERVRDAPQALYASPIRLAIQIQAGWYDSLTESKAQGADLERSLFVLLLFYKSKRKNMCQLLQMIPID